MKYDVKEITDKKTWEDFSLSASPNTFLQSWNWGEFNKAIGGKMWRLGLRKNGKLAGLALLVKYPSKLGDYLYCPRGPIINWKDTNAFAALFKEMKNLGHKEGCLFITVDPLLEENDENKQFFKRV